MSRFHTDLLVKIHRSDGQKRELLSPLIYHTDVLWDMPGGLITVPAGFRTDFASVPRAPLAWLAAGGCADYAAVVHDYLLEQGYKRARADAVFLEAMEDTGVVGWRRTLMHGFVVGYSATQPDPEGAE